MNYDLLVPGVPRTAGSHRAFPVVRRDGRSGVAVTHANPKTREWMDLVAGVFIDQYGRPREEGPFNVRLSFMFERPKSHLLKSGKPRKSAPQYPRWDLDKLSRSILDALTGNLWVDDSQVVLLSAAKGWGSTSGCSVVVEEHAPLAILPPSTPSLSCFPSHRTSQD